MTTPVGTGAGAAIIGTLAVAVKAAGVTPLTGGICVDTVRLNAALVLVAGVEADT
jgi:hypothetical protein